ncbi:transposase [Actinacidiphila sp. DG2A-62]|uniref:transposase n=1 Tax=Actinacidiphila sp. DG2A-62 TaxID=3108821 RepID=UPI003FA34658
MEVGATGEDHFVFGHPRGQEHHDNRSRPSHTAGLRWCPGSRGNCGYRRSRARRDLHTRALRLGRNDRHPSDITSPWALGNRGSPRYIRRPELHAAHPDNAGQLLRADRLWRWPGRLGDSAYRGRLVPLTARRFRMSQPVVGPGVSLTDAQWARIEPLLPDRTPKRGGRWHDHREVLDAIAFKSRTATEWAHLPEKYGNWRGVFNRPRMGPSTARGSGCSLP